MPTKWVQNLGVEPSPPSASKVRAALQQVEHATALDLTPQVPLEAGASEPSVWEVIAGAGPEVNDELDQLARTATPTGRVWAVMLLESRQPAKAKLHLVRMLGDTSPIIVNTCLVGFRTTRDWASHRLGEAAAGAVSRRVRRVPGGLFTLLLFLGWVGAWMAFGWLRER